MIETRNNSAANNQPYHFEGMTQTQASNSNLHAKTIKLIQSDKRIDLFTTAVHPDAIIPSIETPDTNVPPPYPTNTHGDTNIVHEFALNYYGSGRWWIFIPAHEIDVTEKNYLLVHKMVSAYGCELQADLTGWFLFFEKDRRLARAVFDALEYKMFRQGGFGMELIDPRGRVVKRNFMFREPNWRSLDKARPW